MSEIQPIMSSTREAPVRPPATGGVAVSDRAGGQRRRQRRQTSHVGMVAVASVLFAVALFLRLFHIVGSYDLFIDEVSYGDIAQGVARGAGVRLHGEPFTLHPPVLFALFGAVAHLFHVSDDQEQAIYALRNVTAVLGALGVLLVWGIMRALRLGGWVALAAALLVALDPLVLSFDSRLMLESGAGLFSLLTVFFLALLARGRQPVLLTAAAGVAGGLTMSSKETFGLVLGLCVVFVLICGRPVTRRVSGTVLAISVLVYAGGTGVVVALYGWSRWWDDRTGGLERLLGLKQITGFNVPTTNVTLASQLWANLSEYAVTYGVLFLGLIASLVLLARVRPWRGGPPRTGTDRLAAAYVLLPLYAFAACCYLGYATVFGSIEEQMYYITLAPCAMVLLLWMRDWPRAIGHPKAILVMVVLVVAPLLFDVNVWRDVHLSDNNEYRRFLTWEQANVPAGSTVAVTEGTAQFLISNAVLGEWSTLAQLRRHDVDYVLVQTKLVRQGYGLARPAFLDELESRAKVAYSRPAKDGDGLVLFEVRALTGGSSS